MSRPTELKLGALLATAALLSGCSAGGPGPLGDGGAQATLCTPDRPAQWLTIGIWELGNNSNSPVTVQSVNLPADASRVRMTKAWLLPIYHAPKTAISEDIGAGWPYPPNGRPNWDKRQPAAKAVIKGGQDLNLVFGVTRTSAKTSRSGGPLIVYSAGGNTYTLHENQSIVLTNRC